jgi:hypothetical protein
MSQLPTPKQTPSKLNVSHYSPVSKQVSSYNPNAFKSPFSYVGPSTSTNSNTKGSYQKKPIGHKYNAKSSSTVISSSSKSTVTISHSFCQPSVSSKSYQDDQSINTSMIEEEIIIRQAVDDHSAVISDTSSHNESSNNSCIDHDEVIMQLTADDDDDPLRQSAELDYLMAMTEYKNCLPNQFDNEFDGDDDDGTIATAEFDDDEDEDLQSKASSKQQGNRLIRLSMLRTSIHSHNHSRQSKVIVDDGFDVPISKRLSLDGGDMQDMFEDEASVQSNKEEIKNAQTVVPAMALNGTQQTVGSKMDHIDSFYATDPSMWSANIATCVNNDKGSNSFIAMATAAIGGNSRQSTCTAKLPNMELQSTTDLTPKSAKGPGRNNNDATPLDSLWGYCDSFSKRCEFFLSLVVELKNHPMIQQTEKYMVLLNDTEKHLEGLNAIIQQFSKHRSEYHGIAGAMMHNPEEYFVFLLNKTILDGIDLFSMIFEADYHEKVFGLDKVFYFQIYYLITNKIIIVKMINRIAIFPSILLS